MGRHSNSNPQDWYDDSVDEFYQDYLDELDMEEQKYRRKYYNWYDDVRDFGYEHGA